MYLCMCMCMCQMQLSLGFSIGKNPKINIKPIQEPQPPTRSMFARKIFATPSRGSEIGTGMTEPSASVASKFFQLEEKEDKDVCTTEIFLADDGTVLLAETDGPLPLRATGTWNQQGTDFTMKINRTFGAGQPGTDVGEFLFEVERGYIGFLQLVGNLLCVDGTMYIVVSNC